MKILQGLAAFLMLQAAGAAVLPSARLGRTQAVEPRLSNDAGDAERRVGPALVAVPEFIGETARRSSFAKATEDRQTAALHRTASAGLSVAELRCEQDVNPLGVDESQPQLGWVLQSTGRSETQTAYRVLVASTPELLARDQGDLWDSGRVASGDTVGVAYSGRPLRSSQQVFWKVEVWDGSGRTAGWSPTGVWTMGVLDAADWHARWITDPELLRLQRSLAGHRSEDAAGPNIREPVRIANPRANDTLLLRREFTVRPGLRRAVAQICGLGQYELTINGVLAPQGLFSPGWTKYDKTCLYDTLDVTALLRPGVNAAGFTLASGMYNVQEGRYVKFVTEFRPLTAIGQIRLEYRDGTLETVGTDEQWRVAPGPVTFANVFGGEDYDARREPRGWDLPGFDDRQWGQAIAWDGPGGQLHGQSHAAPTLGTFEVLTPVANHPLRPGVVVYDLGQNAALVLRLKARGPAGATVRVIPAELLAADGSVDRGSCGGPAWWEITLAGSGAAEEWSPKFFYHGARYLQVECAGPEGGGGRPAIESIAGLVFSSTSPPAGEFACSNTLFNRIHGLVRWAQRSNMVSVLTDCPHRERLGWIEQNHLNGPALRYEFDLDRLLAKSVGDMADSQLANGLVPDIAPEYVEFSDGFRDSPEWGSACVLVPWQQYEWTGDVGLLNRSYAMMKRYVDYLGSRAVNRIVSHGLGDWYDLGPNPPGYAQLTPVALTATAFYYDDARILSRVSELLGKPTDAAHYRALAAEIREAFNQAFFDPAADRYATGSQTANAIPLVMDLVEPERRSGVLNAVVADVRQRGNALTAGDIGYRYLLRALADGGRSDVIFDMNNQSEKPGYGYQLAQGATSLTEAWDANRNSSQNHFMLGQINEWFYHDLAGIQGDPDGPGFRRIIIRPAVVGDLTWVNAAYNSVRGRIASEWQRDGDRLRLNVTIPPNTTATVCVPAKDADSVTESGQPVAQGSEIQFLRLADHEAVYAVGSGVYAFDSVLP